jgi:hypothetical protein
MATAEVIHDEPTDDPHAWQPIDSLASLLGIAARTVRHRVSVGTLERFATPDGRSYYRAPPGTAPAPRPAPASSSASTDGNGNALAATLHLVEQLALAQRELTTSQVSAARLETEHRATVERLETTAAQLETERQRVERLEDDRRRLEDERQRLTASLEDERHHARQQAARLETLATLTAALTAAPWYAFGRRRHLRRQLRAAQPSAPALALRPDKLPEDH